MATDGYFNGATARRAVVRQGAPIVLGRSTFSYFQAGSPRSIWFGLVNAPAAVPPSNAPAPGLPVSAPATAPAPAPMAPADRTGLLRRAAPGPHHAGKAHCH